MFKQIDCFEPHPLIRGGILQTIVGSQFANSTELPLRRSHKVVLDGNSALVLFELETSHEGKPLVLLAHGMGGCSESGYMKRIAKKLNDRGFGVFMMNHRGSGPGMGLSDKLWNGGSSEDLHQAVCHIVKCHPNRSLLLVGFSLSGNILLKYLGEGRKIAANLYGALAVNPPADLKASSSKLSYGRFATVFNKYYMEMIDRQASALIQYFPKAFPPPRHSKTIREFDEVYTAPAAGYRNVEEYYDKCSASQFLGKIILPTTILNSSDDPFVPADIFQRSMMSLSVRYHEPKSGGHMGYISKEPTPLGDHRWMDYFILSWAEQRF